MTRVRRSIRRTLAPLMAGALAATSVVAVARANILGQDDEGDAPSTLDEAVAAGSPFDLESVFVDLGPMGDYYGIYEYGDDRDDVNVAAALEGFTTADERDAAERFLLDDRCNGLSALAIRRQIVVPVLATIYRTDFDGTGAPDVETVEIGSVTASLLDFDLLSTRDPALVEELVAGDAAIALAGGGSSVERLLGTDPSLLYRGAWEGCLLDAAERGSGPNVTTLQGIEVATLKTENQENDTFDPLSSGTDVVTWLEADPPLEVRVEMSFDGVGGDRPGISALDFGTERFLQVFANPAEPAVEVATRIATRRLDALALLEEEAFAGVAGFEYSEAIAGTEEAIRHALNRASALIDPVTLQTRLGDDSGLESQVRGATARPLFEPGDPAENLEDRFSIPPALASRPPVATVQAVYWEPGFLNSDSFRAGWRSGIGRDAEISVGLEEVATADEINRLVRSDLVLDAVYAEHDGIARLHYLTPCFSVTITGEDAGDVGRVVEGVVNAQIARRASVFGVLTVPPPEDEDGVNLRETIAGTLDDLVAVGAGLTGSAVDDLPVDETEGAGAARASADRLRAARCATNNLVAYRSGLPVTDADRNGIADDLPENTLATPAE